MVSLVDALLPGVERGPATDLLARGADGLRRRPFRDLSTPPFSPSSSSSDSPYADFSRWYAGRSLFVLLIIVGLASGGFWVALGGKSPFGTVALEE